MFNKIIMWSSLILPWLSLFFMKKESIKRYMPVAIFVSLLLTILFEMAYTFQWWIMLDKIAPWGYITNVAFAYGAFLVGTMWIFYFTYQKFWVYMVTNIVIDGLFMFGLSHFFEGRLYNLVNMGRFGVFLLMLFLAVIIYGYQVWQEGVIKNPERQPTEKENTQRQWIRKREKAK
ncbi:hypothetical protein [Ammoniphilus resinae]|uniref:Uncharacterized protein n=1 Tax=Ammoniphilus resinae TaxID=861532 RepID=A0ABS4GNR1_9BACL|nr:hypothetical protein [Ammoniphilus resinae]MBP1931903.1 hypothetical protein [Ammoniphilus resinae]